ncbi:GMC oxidoreductase [Actinomadura fibrosa]|uniref:Cholesterol oxidase n=1 Tax=Actinomadura fibrosa TaxID=111802 RepID=A0ABW2Y218_9ACTN|nr:GMC oxidoreductase [Actinomadura fibrosa]
MGTLSRRSFLQMSAGGGLAVAAGGALAAPAFAAPSGRTDYKAIVVGSGFGGSVSALRLGQAGVDTLVLERGQEWPTDPHKAVFGSQLNYSEKMFWFRTYADWPVVLPFPMVPYAGVMEVSNEAGLNIGCGAGLGGGSLVYTCATVAPPRKYYEKLFPPQIPFDEMTSRWYPKVQAMLRPSFMPDDIYGSRPFTHSRVWDQHVAKAGYRPEKLMSTFNWDVLRQELAGTVRPSAIAGETDFGCSDGAKNSLTVNYIPAAKATGKVQFQTMSEVRSIRRGADGRYRLEVRHLDPWGKTLDTVEYVCEMLFLCAGTLNTNRLLVAARDTGALPDLDASVGTGFGDNGDQYTGYSYVDEAGPSQGAASASTVFIDGEFELPIRVESWQLLQAQGLPVLQTLVMTADLENRGTFGYDRLTGKVRLSDWTGKASAAAKSASDWSAKVMHANPEAVPVNVTWPATLTAHPLGGCALGRSSDLYGRVKGYPGLYVLDGAMVPGSIGGANPSFTIAALAERCVADIIAKAG